MEHEFFRYFEHNNPVKTLNTDYWQSMVDYDECKQNETCTD